jgi:hypothetical protein
LNHLHDFEQNDAFYTYASFRYNSVRFSASKLRISLQFSNDSVDVKALPGYSRLLPFVGTLFPNQLDEQYPQLHCDPKTYQWFVDGQPA